MKNIIINFYYLYDYGISITNIQDQCIYSFLIDKGVCENNPCENGGTCMPGIGEYTCQCQVGFLGKHCEVGRFLALSIF